MTAAPTATYRLQLQPDFTFAHAARAVPHLAALGVSHLHLSPVLEAVPGSAHGYDVTSHDTVRAELGGEDGLRHLAYTARRHGLGIVVDIVPNHMAVPVPLSLNRPLWEVLRDGPRSRYARWFDIDWNARATDDAPGQVLLPVLRGRLGGELMHLTRDGAVLRYHDHVLPLRPGTETLPLPDLLDAQWYRLGWWRLARTELNHRRFFTVSGLIGLRVEDPEVFESTHGLLLRLVAEGVVDGLRIDHPDGLADPGGYLRTLDRRIREEAGGPRWTVVEKILTDGEVLPAAWPVAGTTGYDTLRHIDGLFLDPAGAGELAARYRAFTGVAAERGGDWDATLREAVRRVVTHELASEVAFLSRTAERICRRTPALRDHAPWALRTAVCELLARIPVYRPYVSPGRPAPDGDRALLEGAAAEARSAFPVPEEADAVHVVLALALGGLGGSADHRAFCLRFAQTASAVRAKSAEDKAFYRYTPLVSAGEVGGDPGRPAVSPGTFHSFCARIRRAWPATGTVLSTHDTKRSADVRARLAVLTEAPQDWADLVERVTKETARAGRPAPDPHLAWTAWQTVLGLGVPDPERVVPALLKAAREAELHTSWTDPEPAYEEAVAHFAEAGPCGPPYAAVAAYGRTVETHVRANVLGTALLHLTVPGVPDLYQGSEEEFRALVDPDNRRPPRFRPDVLARLDEGGTPQGPAEDKLRLTAEALRLRRERPDLFGAAGNYAPLTARGPAAEHCVAFCRGGAAVTAVTRLSLRLTRAGGWRNTVLELPQGTWRDRMGGRTRNGGPVRTAELFASAPAVLLTRLAADRA
ncbi:malto-oligosyltrehalose synthase [Streptomyces meridianus]|uniref:Malto-oligosyltrehalose synthase n=1 Tax=Streptomyces meridianus TaxID=2938945 RepID=A0ABT0X324_9ACTN|nr:malto-oligosyltrehalose synthase [Streptomyces meridianus]MCM2576923.1 malto-oligosyltrehalose synthase [Streptomyces meridianus]